MERVKELLKSYNLDEDQVEQLNETIVHVIDESITNVLSCVMPLVPIEKASLAEIVEHKHVEDVNGALNGKEQVQMDEKEIGEKENLYDLSNNNISNNNNNNNNNNKNINNIGDNTGAADATDDENYYNDEYFHEKYKNLDEKKKNEKNMKQTFGEDGEQEKMVSTQNTNSKIGTNNPINSQQSNHVSNEKLEAVKFLHRNQSHFKNELQKRHDSYKDYLRYVSELEFYCDCLAEKPKYKERFRNKNIRFSNEEEEILSKIEADELQKKIDMFQSKRDQYRKRIRIGDKRVHKFIMGMLNDQQAVEEAHLLYIEMCRTDEQIINDKWVQKLESTPKPSNKFRYRAKLKCFDNVSHIVKTANNYYEEPTNEVFEKDGTANEVVEKEKPSNQGWKTEKPTKEVWNRKPEIVEYNCKHKISNS